MIVGIATHGVGTHCPGLVASVARGVCCAGVANFHLEAVQPAVPLLVPGGFHSAPHQKCKAR
jgi:hypothetical protein